MQSFSPQASSCGPFPPARIPADRRVLQEVRTDATDHWIIQGTQRRCAAHGCSGRPLSRIFQKIRLAEPYFRLISGLAEFLRKLRNSAENTPEHHKFGQQDRQIETMKFKI